MRQIDFLPLFYPVWQKLAKERKEEERKHPCPHFVVLGMFFYRENILRSLRSADILDGCMERAYLWRTNPKTDECELLSNVQVIIVL